MDHIPTVTKIDPYNFEQYHFKVGLFFFLQHMQLWYSHSTAESDAVWKEARLPSNLYTGQLSTMCDMVWVATQMHSGLLSV